MSQFEIDARRFFRLLDDLTGGEEIHFADDEPIMLDIEERLQTLRRQARS